MSRKRKKLGNLMHSCMLKESTKNLVASIKGIKIGFPTNIHLNEDVFRLRLHQDEFIRLIQTSSEDVFKTSSRRLD